MFRKSQEEVDRTRSPNLLSQNRQVCLSFGNEEKKKNKIISKSVLSYFTSTSNAWIDNYLFDD